MDRLICGDVGYGKTEVALRAAFKAVMDGKQVAMLVPTTILAQQHFRTFQQRLAAFPVEVDMLSRFRTQSQQKGILNRMQEGTLDIVIGTHRLVQSDIKFSDLGLVIIDEEQRFGVTHKEHLKHLHSQVDILTMTATPIPRTLYMALTGVRDISTINTPPEERLPIVTHVGGYSHQLVRQAILRELERGGQVFFVHNRVQTILAMRNQLSRVVPEARIEIVHGQMAEKALANRMQEFTRGEIDVLVTTSIIESGLDIPNANTLIVDRADTFGLAQLYQLRGRVGRGAQRAYAYFFRHNHRPPTDEGKLRLETIAENSQLGSGYSIAMRDLEIRGTGDILGTRQHGHIAAVGFHLYTRLLNQAVDQMRKTGKLPSESLFAYTSMSRPLINIDLPIIVNIPQNYVPDKTMRLGLYRRLAELNTLEEIEALTNEFTDRFGVPPKSVENLFFQLRIKLLAERAGLASISGENNQLALRFPSPPKDAPPRQYPALGKHARTSKNTIWLSIKDNTSWQDRLLNLLIILGEKMTTDELDVA
ncbi:MAG: DEAD/DEAH box helicase [Chloroflexi bacterium]|nr:DEAD/DEAH box helicase [Chloroflexota bacterium]